MAEDEAPSSENEQLTRRSLDAETGDSADPEQLSLFAVHDVQILSILPRRWHA